MGIFNSFSKKNKVSFNNIEGKVNGVQFGYKCSWFAIKSDNIEDVFQKIKNDFNIVKADNFSNGIKHGYDGDYSLFKPINGWCLLVGAYGGQYLEQIRKKGFAEIHFYSTHRSSNFIHIAKIVNDTTEREFSISDGEIIINKGNPTEIELKLAQKGKKWLMEGEKDQEMIEYNNKRNILEFLGDEEGLLDIAKDWSLRTKDLDKIKVDDFSLLLLLMKNKS